MKKKQIAMLLAAALTLTQCAAVPTAAADLTMDAVQTQEAVWDDCIVEETVELEEDLPAEESVEASISDDGTAEGPADAEEDLIEEDDEEEILPEDSTETGNAETEEPWILEEEAVIQDDAEEAMEEIFSAGDTMQYRLEYDFVDTIGNGAMLPNTTMTISTMLVENINGEWTNLLESDYTLELEALDNDYGTKFEASVDTANNQKIVIRSEDETGYFQFLAKVWLGGKEICTREIYFSISNYMLTPQKLPDTPAVGETIDLSQAGITLVEYNSATQTTQPVDMTDFKLEVWSGEEDGVMHYDYDTRGWKLTPGGGDVLPKMTRTTENPTWFAVIACRIYPDGIKSQVARIIYRFDSWLIPDDNEENNKYELYVDSPDTIGDFAMLPQSQMTIVTDLRDKSNAYSKVTEYRLEVKTQSAFGTATVSADGKSLVIESGDNIGSDRCCVSVQVPDESGSYKEAFKKDIFFSVRNYRLTPQKFSDNPKVGTEIDLSQAITLVEYDSAAETTQPVDMTTNNFKLVIDEGTTPEGNKWHDYDLDGWTLTPGVGDALPKMIRKTTNHTWFAVSAYEKDADGNWYQIARLKYDFDSLSNSNEGGEGNSDNEWHEDDSEEKSPYVLWNAYTNTIGDSAMLPQSQMTIVTDLRDKSNAYSEVTDYRLEVVTQSKFGTATVSADGKSLVIESGDNIGSGWCYISVQVPDGSSGYTEVFKKDMFFSVSNYRLTPQKFSNNPAVGTEIDLSQVITLEEYDSAAGTTRPVDMTTNKFKLVIDEGTTPEGNEWHDYDLDGWTLTPGVGDALPKMIRKTTNPTWFAVSAYRIYPDGGESQVARLRYDFDPLSNSNGGGEGNSDNEWHEDDSEEKSPYELWYDSSDTIGNGAMLPNSQMTITTQLVDKTDEDSEIEDYRLVIEEQSKFGTATVSADGKSLVIKSGDKIGSGWCYISVQVPDGSGGYTEVFKKDMFFSVSNYMLTPRNFSSNPEVGTAIDLSQVIKLEKYDSATETTQPVDMTTQKFKLAIDEGTTDEGDEWHEYDLDGWTLIPGVGDALPKMIRETEDNTWFTVTAYEKTADDSWNQVAKLRYDFEPLYDDSDDDNEWHDDDSEEKSNYELWLNYRNTIGNGSMLPQSQMTIGTDLRDKTNNYSKITDYRLVIEEQSKFGTATLIEDEKTLSIQSGDEIGEGCCYVSVQISDGSGGYTEVFKRDISFEVSQYILTPQILRDKNGNILNPKVNESIDLNEAGIQLCEYREGQLYGIGDPDSLKVVVYTGMNDETGEMDYDYDTRGWTMQTVPGKDLPIMTRISPEYTWFAVTALQKDEDTGEWNQLTRREYHLDEVDAKPHTHSWKKGKVTKEATCTSDGIRVDACDCGKKTEVRIPAKGHNKVKDAAVAATVFAQGKTEGSHCSVCGTVFKKQNTVAKLTPKISLTASSLKMKTGQSTTAFKASGFAKGDYLQKVVSGNTKIVKAEKIKKDGTFKLTAGKKAGSTTVTVSLASGKRAAFKVTVQKSAVKTTKITTTIKNLTLKKGETYKKLASSVVVAPVTSKEKITYSSSNKKVATVDSKGVIKAKKAGTAKITVKSGSKKVVVTVKVPAVKTTKLTGVPAAKTIAKGKTFTIKATAAPKNTDEKITYKTSNKKIATVTSKGVVKGIRKGTATITVQSGSKKMTCKVTVK